MPCSTAPTLASNTRSSAHFIVRRTCPPTLQSPNPSRVSLVNYSLYKLNRIGDKQHSCLTPLPIFFNDQFDTRLPYFTMHLLWSSTCFQRHMFIIRRLNCIDAASCIVTLSKWLSGAQVEISLTSGAQLENSLSTCVPDGHLLGVTIPDGVSKQFNFLMMST
jgi:hypothetical protein